MNSPFVPLLPERDPKASLRAELKTSFRPSSPLSAGTAGGSGSGNGGLATGGSPLPSDPTSMIGTPEGLDPAALPEAAAASLGCTAVKRRDPVVELIRDGNRVSHLKITCGCGEVITIECQFDRASA